MYNDDVTLDDEGANLADPHAAFAHALKAAGSLAAESVVHGHLVRTHRIEIRDAEQNSVGTVHFEEAADIRP